MNSETSPAVTQEAPQGKPGAAVAYTAGRENVNPQGMSLLALWREDLRTHDGQWLSPGFQALAAHRFGNWRMSVRPKPLRAPFSLLYKLWARYVKIHYGIELDYTVRLGRRVRIWHQGGMVLSAIAVGDDVHIRHNTTFGVARSGADILERPVIGNRVDIGVGTCILGGVTVGDDSILGANSVVIRDVPPRSVAVGVPAKVIRQLPPRPSEPGTGA
jgi:serine O-acetyltransferase